MVVETGGKHSRSICGNPEEALNQDLRGLPGGSDLGAENWKDWKGEESSKWREPGSGGMGWHVQETEGCPVCQEVGTGVGRGRQLDLGG